MPPDRPHSIHFPRWMAPIVWPIGLLIVHAGIPYALSTFSDRHGWFAGAPGVLNQCGLIPAAAGCAILVWAMAEHYGAAPHGWDVERPLIQSRPEYLLSAGPYRYSRNPMYLAAVAIWLGWTWFFGSIAVLAGSTAMWTAMEFWIIPYEERRLTAEFGDTYRDYQRRAARWFGRPGTPD